MSIPSLYRGHWPKNVNRTAKYHVKYMEEKWRVTVICELGEGLKVILVESGDAGIAGKVNAVKKELVGQEGGAFYINEYQHLIVPISEDNSSNYYEAGKVESEFIFNFEGDQLTTKPVDSNGNPLTPGDSWVGPRPGIPYVLAAGGRDIYYETPALTDEESPKVRKNVTQKSCLSKLSSDKSAVDKIVQTIADIRGSQGGRFYVNEHKAIFTPVDKGDGNGLDYIYCGQLDLQSWFPEPPLT